MLYIKYFIWHKTIWNGLLSHDRGWPNAFLITGRKGIGKLAFAQALSRYLLCEARESLAACGKCQSCLWFAGANHPDFRVLEPAAYNATADEEQAEGKKPEKASNQIAIEQIRALDDFVNLTSHRNGSKVILIHPAEAMNPPAANALLKTLEEPPGSTVFILVSHAPQRLLPTIISRCRGIPLPVPAAADSLKWLRGEGVAQPEIALAQAGYAPLAALEMNAQEKQNQRRDFLERLVAAIPNPLALAEHALQYPLADVVNWLQKWVCDLVYCKFTGKIRYHLDFADKLERLAEKSDAVGLLRYYRELLAAQRAVQHPLNPKLVLEYLALSYCLAMKNE